jgi:hypothetical protein
MLSQRSVSFVRIVANNSSNATNSSQSEGENSIRSFSEFIIPMSLDQREQVVYNFIN